MVTAAYFTASKWLSARTVKFFDPARDIVWLRSTSPFAATRRCRPTLV